MHGTVTRKQRQHTVGWCKRVVLHQSRVVLMLGPGKPDVGRPNHVLNRQFLWRPPCVQLRRKSALKVPDSLVKVVARELGTRTNHTTVDTQDKIREKLRQTNGSVHRISRNHNGNDTIHGEFAIETQNRGGCVQTATVLPA
jgi:hypothetical protein